MRDAELRLRRRSLCLRSQQLRAALARDVLTLARPVRRFTGVGTALVRYAGGPGQPFVTLLGLVLVWRLRRGLGTVLRLWGLRQGWCKLRRWLQP